MLVIFDVDGTLLDSWDWMAGELIANAGRFGYRKVERPELERLRGLETWKVLHALAVPADRTLELVAHLRIRAEAAAANLTVFDGVPDLLADLHQRGDRLAVVSSNSDAAVAAALGSDIDSLFAYRRCGTGVFDKAVEFEAIMEQDASDPASALAVGDESRDIDAARQAGIEFVAVEWGYADGALLRAKAPGRTAATIGQLAAMIADERIRVEAGSA